MAEQVIRVALPSLVNSVVGALTADPAFAAAITAEVRRATSRFAEAGFFGGGDDAVPLAASLQATLAKAAADGHAAAMELEDGSDADLIGLK